MSAPAAEAGPAMGDCDVCGWSISYGDPDGALHPDADVFCEECGARHVCNVEDEDAWLILAERPTERIAALVAERDAYRAQATAFAESLIELGRGDVVDRALAEAAS